MGLSDRFHVRGNRVSIEPLNLECYTIHIFSVWCSVFLDIWSINFEVSLFSLLLLTYSQSSLFPNLCHFFHAWFTFLPWRRRQHIPPKHGFHQSLQTYVRIVPQLGLYYFLPNYFHFVIPSMIWRYMPVFCLDTEIVIR